MTKDFYNKIYLRPDSEGSVFLWRNELIGLKKKCNGKLLENSIFVHKIAKKDK